MHEEHLIRALKHGKKAVDALEAAMPQAQSTLLAAVTGAAVVVLARAISLIARAVSGDRGAILQLLELAQMITDSANADEPAEDPEA